MIRRIATRIRRLGAKAPPPLLVGASSLWHGEPALPVIPGPSGISGTQALDDHLMIVLDSLQRADVACAVIEAGTMRRRVVMTTTEQAERVRAALGALPCSVRTVSPDVLRVHSGNELFGCDVELWRPTSQPTPRPDGGTSPIGTLLAPRANRWLRYVEPSDLRYVSARIDGRDVPTIHGLLRPHLLDVQFPVDAVFTWVDGTDPRWLARKDAAWQAEHAGERHSSAGTASRFTSHDELRYALRSLETYADWVRNIFVVTDGQSPLWLRRDHPRLRVVDHRELFEATDALPTFNSHAIEARLQHIEGLAEHFLYLNDDVFFGRPVRPEMFFEASGATRFFLTDATIDMGEPSSRDLPVASAAKQTRRIVDELFGGTVTQRFQHVAHPQRRSVLADLADRLPLEVERTWSATFRSPNDLSIPSSLAHYFGYATGRAVPGQLAYTYCDVTERRAPIKLQRLARRRDSDMFCINETDTPAGHPGHRLMMSFLDEYFPHASSFERADSAGSSC